MSSKLQEIAQQLRTAGASLPAPENKGTPESALVNGLSIALLLVENAIKEDQKEVSDNELKPCPICGCKDIQTYDCDDDSFIKTITASCSECGLSINSSIDWKPYSKTWDIEGFNAAWKAKITTTWNTRS